MLDDGSTKDDVKVPENEIGDRINKLFNEEQKDTSKSCRYDKH
jgi:translation initiation factor 5A